MNVLVFVITMLAVLSILTYGRVESFRNFALVQNAFENYMQATARQGVNELAVDRYIHTHVPAKYSTNKNPANPASTTLSFNLFIDKDERKTHSAELPAFRTAAKNLMTVLYSQKPFFQKIEENRPMVIDEILDALIRISDGFTDKEKISRPKELATIDLENEELNLAFTYMLKGMQANPSDEESGYRSLLDFITVKKNKLVIRVFLASRELLIALFGSPELADQIIATREQLYKRLGKSNENTKEPSEEFKNLYQGQRLPFVTEKMLNFDVSKTNPAQYR